LFERLLAKIAQALDAADLPYMVIGGQAVLLYGEARLTEDVDVTLGADLSALPAVLERVEAIDLAPLVEDPDAFTQDTMVLPCADADTETRVDFVFSFSPYERRAIERARRVEMAGADVRFAAPEDVVIHKLVAGRPRDHEDVKGILAQNPDLDEAYLRRWLDDFSDALGQPLTDRFDDLRAQT
jgi:predicted nucleotidyltransferase